MRGRRVQRPAAFLKLLTASARARLIAPDLRFRPNIRLVVIVVDVLVLESVVVQSIRELAPRIRKMAIRTSRTGAHPLQ